MVNLELLEYCLKNTNDYSPVCVSELEAAYYETGDVEFLLEAQRRKMAAYVYWYQIPKMLS